MLSDKEARQRLILWREQRGYSQQDAASWYGVTERTWRRWEAGEVRVPKHVRRRILHRLTVGKRQAKEVT